MSELAFPEIAEPATQQLATVETKQATLKETALASFAPIVAHMAALAQRYRNVAFDVLTPKGMAAAKAARLELREEGRYAVQRLQKRLKEEANDLKRTIDAKAEEAIGIVKPVEDAIHEQIEVRETQLAAEKAERERLEAERKAKHEAGIAKVRAYLTHCQQPGMTAARIQAGIEMLRAATFGPEWEEFAVPAASAQCETIEAMQALHAAAVAREEAAARAAAEAERIEAQRIENERIAAEQRAQAEALAAQQRALAEQAAALQRQADELAAKQAAAAEAQRLADEEIEAARLRAITPAANVATAAATLGTAETPEPGTLEAAPITQDAQESGFSPADAPACTSSEAQAAQASPSGSEGTGAHAEERAPRPARGDCQNPLDCLGYSPDNDCWATCGGLAAPDTTSEAAPQQAGVQFLSNELDIARAGYSHEADTAPAAISDTIRDRVLDLQALKREALESRFPSQPKMPPEWWAAFFAAVDSLAAEVA